MIFLKKYQQGVCIALHVQPRASRTKIIGLYGDALKIAIQAPPVDGAANEAICEYFSNLFHCAKKNISILNGEGSRKKSIYIDSVSIEQAKQQIHPFLSQQK